MQLGLLRLATNRKHALQLGPSISCPAILTLRHFHVRHFQSTIQRKLIHPSCVDEV